MHANSSLQEPAAAVRVYLVVMGFKVCVAHLHECSPEDSRVFRLCCLRVSILQLLALLMSL